jgi:hypothetical protein
MDELLRIFVLGVEWFALWLEHSPLHVVWPVLFVALFQAFLSVVHRSPVVRPRHVPADCLRLPSDDQQGSSPL